MNDDIFIGQPALVTRTDFAAVDAALGQFLPAYLPFLKWQWERKTSGSALHMLTDAHGTVLVCLIVRTGGPKRTSVCAWAAPHSACDAAELLMACAQWISDDQARFKALAPKTGVALTRGQAS